MVGAYNTVITTFLQIHKCAFNLFFKRSIYKTLIITIMNLPAETILEEKKKYASTVFRSTTMSVLLAYISHDKISVVQTVDVLRVSDDGRCK